MNVIQLRIKNDPETLSYIENFSQNQVILGDYYYSVPTPLFTNAPLYTEEQIARILHLTDTEYAGLISKFYPSNTPGGEVESPAEIEQKIKEIESKIDRSRNLESNEQRLPQLEAELQEIMKELQSIDQIQQQCNLAQQEYAKYAQFSRFNLQKMHSDIVTLMDQITRAEEELMNIKVVQITHAQNSGSFDMGKLVFALGCFVAVILICLILKIIEAPTLYIIVIGFLGCLVSLILVLTAKNETEHTIEEEGPNTNQESKKVEIEGLRAQKDAILRIVNVKTTDEFFHLKAKLASVVKTVQYLQEQRDRTLNGKKIEEMMANRSRLENEIASIKNNIANPTDRLSSEDYLRYYREMDTLKLKLKQNTEISNENVLDTLSKIRKELADKLPDYKELLQNTFRTSFSKIKGNIDTLALKLSLPPVLIDQDGNGYDSLSEIQKIVVEFSLVRNFYHSGFVFAVDCLSTRGEGIAQKFKQFITLPEVSDVKFYILDENTPI